SYGVADVRAGALGDPLYPVAQRRGAPWTSALAALAVGEVAGVEVTVHQVGDGVVLRAGDRSVAIGPCGSAAQVPEMLGPPWPERAVLAQATIEAVGAALRSGDHVMARRLAALASRLDPIGASGVSAVVASVDRSQPSEGERLGMVAGAMVATLPNTGKPVGADAEREARPAAWADVAGSWAVSPDLATCPSVLGP
ncbi:MAG: hypothetical protein JRI25_23460, partial [Deltaproteobacteria bacterium]|nr:hypothetical protein [Deltaproteobacteria bacterium]